jgi:hypothetical protein
MQATLPHDAASGPPYRHIPAPAPDDRISDLVAAVASLQEELKAQRVRATSPAPPCARAPSSLPGPPPDVDSDSMFSLALRNRYVPLSSTLGGRAPPARTPDGRPQDRDSSFRALRDSDPLLRRRAPRSRSRSRSPGSPSRRRLLELNTPTSSDVCRFLSPYCRGFSRAHRHRSPPRGSRSSSSSWSYPGQRDSRRTRPEQPPRPTQHREPTRRPSAAGSPPTGNDLHAAPADDSAAALDAVGPATAAACQTSTTETICAAVRETLTVVVHSKDAQWDAVRHNLSGQLLQLYSSNPATRPSSVATKAKIAELQRIVSVAAAGWESACIAPAGTLLEELGSDHPSSVSQLDALTVSDNTIAPEVTNKGTGTRPGSPFSPAGEDPAASPPATPHDVSAVPCPPAGGKPPASASLGMVPSRAEPMPPPSHAAPSTSKTLLGECLSGPEDFMEETPQAAPVRARSMALPDKDTGPRPPLAPAGPPAADHTAAPEPAPPGTRASRKGRLQLRRPGPPDTNPRAPRYPPLPFVHTTDPCLSALDRSTGRACQRSFSPSPPRSEPPARSAAPAPPAAHRKRIMWPTPR